MRVAYRVAVETGFGVGGKVICVFNKSDGRVEAYFPFGTFRSLSSFASVLHILESTSLALFSLETSQPQRDPEQVESSPPEFQTGVVPTLSRTHVVVYIERAREVRG